MRTIFFLTLLTLASCKPNEPVLTAQQIVDKSIVVSGADKIASSKISFSFRNRTYIATRNKGTYLLERITKRDSVEIRDVLSNKGFLRYKNSGLVQVPDSMMTRYSNSVNSVHYFSVLPFGLNDKAVFKKCLSDTTIKGVDYYKIQVTFSEDGGGDDFDDVFLYWINKDNFQIDYLAYKYNTGKGGMRFRDVKNESVVNEIRFVNYNNYKPTDPKMDFSSIDKAYQDGQLEKLSEIILENIKVTLIDF